RESDLIGSNRELSFLVDLVRGLLRTLEPEQVARRAAGAIYEGTNAALSTCAVENNGHALADCVFDREGSVDNPALINLQRLGEWLRSSRSPAFLTNSSE